MINILNIIKRIVQEKLKFRHHTQLVVDALCQKMTDFAPVMADFVEQGLFISGDKKAQVDFCDGKILAYLNFGHCYQSPFEQIPALLLKNDAQILLDQT